MYAGLANCLASLDLAVCTNYISAWLRMVLPTRYRFCNATENPLFSGNPVFFLQREVWSFCLLENAVVEPIKLESWCCFHWRISKKVKKWSNVIVFDSCAIGLKVAVHQGRLSATNEDLVNSTSAFSVKVHLCWAWEILQCEDYSETSHHIRANQAAIVQGSGSLWCNHFFYKCFTAVGTGPFTCTETWQRRHSERSCTVEVLATNLQSLPAIMTDASNASETNEGSVVTCLDPDKFLPRNISRQLHMCYF